VVVADGDVGAAVFGFGGVVEGGVVAAVLPEERAGPDGKVAFEGGGEVEAIGMVVLGGRASADGC
jgi:hypothetical protein